MTYVLTCRETKQAARAQTPRAPAAAAPGTGPPALRLLPAEATVRIRAEEEAVARILVLVELKILLVEAEAVVEAVEAAAQLLHPLAVVEAEAVAQLLHLLAVAAVEVEAAEVPLQPEHLSPCPVLHPVLQLQMEEVRRFSK